MKINRHGKAKVLTLEEIIRLFTIGLKRSRDRALFGTCLYTGCRIAEASQMKYQDAFFEDSVRSTITIRKANTKGKLGTRVIATHPNLKKILENYRLESLELVQFKKTYGDWSHFSSQEAIKVICPECQSPKTRKQGVENNVQLYKCLNCSSHFRNSKLSKENQDLPQINEKKELSKEPEITYKSGLDFYDKSETLISDTTTCDLSKVANVEYPGLKKIPIPSINHLGVENSVPYGLLFLNPDNDFLFPGQYGNKHITNNIVNTIFTKACARAGIKGAGTHSLRRTTLTTLHKQGIPLKVIQEISGHKQLANLQAYLEVDDDQLDDAINSLL